MDWQISHVPANLSSSLHSPIVVHLNIIKVTANVIFQIEGVKRQPHQVAWSNTDVPCTVGTMGVIGGMARACDGAWRTS